MPRRRPGALVPLEAEILEQGLALCADGERFHGFQLAERLRGERGALLGHGTLYKALGRLLEADLLEAVWEDPDTAHADGRPRRRLYVVSVDGARALAAHRAGEPVEHERFGFEPAGGVA